MSNELYSLVNGKKVDADLHNEILSEGDEIAAKKVSLKLTLEWGFSEEESRSFLGLNDTNKSVSNEQDCE